MQSQLLGQNYARTSREAEWVPSEDAILPVEFLELTIWANRELGIDLYKAVQKWTEHVMT